MKTFDETDAMILRELLSDGRKSFIDIADALQTTKEIVWKRYNEMKKTGSITGATIQFNYPLFGYESIASICLNVNTSHLSNVLKNLRTIQDSHTIQVFNSTFNILVITTFQSLKSLDDTKSVLRANPTNSVRTHLWTDVRNTPENLTFGFPETKLKSVSKSQLNEKSAFKLDEIDHQLVNELAKDGRKPFSEIAETIGTSTDTISRRYTRLVKGGYIKVTIQFNPAAFGYKGLAIFFLSIHQQNELKAVIEELTKTPDISYITKLTGDYELQFAVLIRDFNQLLEANRIIIRLPGIDRIETCFREAPPAWPGPKQYITTF
jgi:Transcriptional regulators